MKKALLIVSLIFIIILTSCTYNGYSGNRKDLYSVTINSVLWTNGYSWGADFKCDPQIKIIDEDHYGRIIFTYHEKYYKGANISFSALIVCQSSNDEEVFYYEDFNYIIKRQDLYSQNLIEFTQEEIVYLKSINDWNKEINYDKCVRKKITNNKAQIPHEEEIKKQIIDEFKLTDSKYSLFIDFLTSNSVNSKYIIYGYIDGYNVEDIYFIGLVEKYNLTKINIVAISNVYDYKAEFIDFKNSSNWE